MDAEQSADSGQSAKIAARCVECGLCRRDCAFLQQHGSPKAIAAAWPPASAKGWELPFQCSLCGLCAAVCPPRIGLDPAAMFQDMRRQAVNAGFAPLPTHRRMLAYENRGCSALYSGLYLPPGCETALFPGCAFAGSRPARLLELFHLLRQRIPKLGVALHCCSKPSQDLGCAEQAAARFAQLTEELARRGLRRIVTVCPSCHAMFRQHGGPLEASFVAEALDGLPMPAVRSGGGTVAVHDPCVLRGEEAIHKAVRKLLRQAGLTVAEMPHHGRTAFCCGEGGAAASVCKAFARSWGDRRCQEAGGLPVVTCCAGCAEFLADRMRSTHLLDLLLAPAGGRVKVARAPFTYLNRLLLKRRLRRLLQS